MLDYSHVFFDLDHTLWDFNTNCKLTLDELYDSHSFTKLGFTKEEFYTQYILINNSMWQDYNRGILTKEAIRSKRFILTFEKLKISTKLIPKSLEDDFITLCPAKGNLFPHTLETLDYLKNKGYTLSIITNGFKETQFIKLNTSGLLPFFNHIIESDSCGFMKPDPRIFDFALLKNNATTSNSIMIGDDLEADILGAKKSRIDQIFINRIDLIHDEKITFEIDCLSKIKSIL